MIYFQTRVTVNMSMGGGRSSRVAGVSVIITCQDDKANDAGLTSDEYDQLVKMTKFTEFEIVTLWNHFKSDFPQGDINKSQLSMMIKKTFPKCQHPQVVSANLFRVFDQDKNGTIRFHELLLAFSMSMRGSAEEKLKWAFRLYDLDGSGRVEQDEFETIFETLCKITRGPSTTAFHKRKKSLKEKVAEKVIPPTVQIIEPKSILSSNLESTKGEEGQKKRVEFKKNLEEEKKADIEEKKPIDLKPILTIKVDEPTISVFNCDPTPEPKADVAGSVGMLMMSKRKTKNWLNVPVKPKQSPTLFPEQKEEEEEMVEEVSDSPYTIKGAKVNLLDTKIAEVMKKDPERDCRIYNVKARAKEIFKTLDLDGNGFVDEDEFIEGCMLDEVFVDILVNFDADKLWGKFGL